MKKFMKGETLKNRRWLLNVVMLLSLGIWSGASAEPDTIWVTNEVTVDVLGRAASNATVLTRVSSGTALSIVRKGRRFTLVEVTLEDGGNKRGWVANEWLQDTPPPAVALEMAQASVKRLTAAQDEWLMEREALQDELVGVRDDFQVQQRSLEDLQQRYDALALTSSQAVQLAEDNQQLEQQEQQLGEQLSVLLEENNDLRDLQLLYWAIAGAGVLFVGILLGLLLPKLSRRQDDRWM